MLLLSLLLSAMSISMPNNVYASDITSISSDAYRYLRYIGVHLLDRSAVVLGEPINPSNRSGATVDWLKSEAVRSGISENNIEEQVFNEKSESQQK
ncbi:hypothetical protein [Paenibacillus xylanexedens]|uniref:hypothetical protein n=1 Tax=Paenibacillus xylanexedens TaxID=528191 RepID=UPI0016426CBA|nr:hypothetical protein [Paenibacillus xylanexedens]